jgi:hypothetical protein
MALNASSKLRPKVIALQKRGALTEKKARETYRATVRVRTRRSADSES